MTEEQTSAIQAAVTQMGLKAPVMVANDVDGMKPAEIMEYLESKIGSEMVICGDWRVGDALCVDTFDWVLKFVEDNFTRARRYKCYGTDPGTAWYAVLACGRLS